VDSYPRETVELVPVVVTVDGVPVTENVQLALTGVYGERPSAWSDPVVAGDDSGVLISALDPGVYRVWAKVTDSPEVPVVECGSFRVT
jgi:hypothetical protein